MGLREDLKALGLSDEQLGSAENVLRLHIASEFIPKHRFDELSEKSRALSKDIGVLEKEKGDAEARAKKAEDALAPLQEQLNTVNADWQKKYTDLEASHKKAEEDRITLETYNARVGALRSYLGDTVYDTDMVISLIDLESLEVKEGKVLNVDKAVDQIRKDKAFLFKDDYYQSTAPRSAPKQPGTVANFGSELAKRAQATDALVQAASDKYFK